MSLSPPPDAQPPNPRPPGAPPGLRATALVLPPALTYLLARGVANADRRLSRGDAAGDAASVARVAGLLRDAARALHSRGATPDETREALRDAVEAVAASFTAPGLRAALDEAVAVALDAPHVDGLDAPPADGRSDDRRAS